MTDEDASVTYDHIRYPVDLVELEKRDALPPTLLKLLTFLRFADPRTGAWETTTLEVAKLLHSGRSTAQKTIRSAEQRGYIHVRHDRGRTVRLTIVFGGFPVPEHLKLGLAPLRWDREFTEPSTVTEQQKSNPQPVENSAAGPDQVLPKPNPAASPTSQGTVPQTNNVHNVRTNDVRTNDDERDRLLKNEQFVNERFVATTAVDKPKTRKSYTPVADFVPRDAEEETVKHLAALLGERWINPFLWAYKELGLRTLQEDCGAALGLMRAGKLRGRPGQYVMDRVKRRKKLQS